MLYIQFITWGYSIVPEQVMPMDFSFWDLKKFECGMVLQYHWMEMIHKNGCHQMWHNSIISANVFYLFDLLPISIFFFLDFLFEIDLQSYKMQYVLFTSFLNPIFIAHLTNTVIVVKREAWEKHSWFSCLLWCCFTVTSKANHQEVLLTSLWSFIIK